MGYVKYNAPNMKRLRKTKKQALEKIAKQTHTTTRKARSYIDIAKVRILF